MNGITFTCACCGRKKQTDWPEPQWALELAAWALDTGWHPLWGQNRGGQFVRLFALTLLQGDAAAQPGTGGAITRELLESCGFGGNRK